jgi:uncharacterized protein (TIGR02145 family)
MQGWDGCAALPTPTYTAGTKSTYFTQGLTLMDARDGKSYEIRKFPDGKCWMVDNLRYGGQTDNCSGRTAFSGNGSSSATNRFGTGTYGDCRDPHAGGSAPCAAGGTQCGYYYNWQATMQAASAYYNVSYTTTYPHQGICPTGWHVPRGGTDDNSEFVKLDKSVGGTGANGQTSTNYTSFWKPTSTTSVTTSDPWKGIYSGSSGSSGGLSSQSSYGYWWSSTQVDATLAYYLFVHTSFVSPQGYSNKNGGFTVRCVQDEPPTLQEFTSADCAAASAGVVGTFTNNGTGSYIVRKLADNNCYVNMGSKQWYGSNVATGNCTPSSTSYPACNTCYAISNSNDWFLPTYTQYNSLVTAAGSGSQLYTALGLGANTTFWSSSEYTSSTQYAVSLYVTSSSAYTVSSYKAGSHDVLCRRN